MKSEAFSQYLRPRLNFICYFEMERIRIISYLDVMHFLFFPCLSLLQIKDIFTNEGFPLRGVTTKSISCNSRLNITLEVSFYTGIPQGKTIEGVFQSALESGNIANLTKSNTVYTITFSGKWRK